MARPLSLLLIVLFCSPAFAHEPKYARHQMPDLIGPIGNTWRLSHRRVYNRPTDFAGRIAHFIAPSSQEAMTWHRATHNGYYQNNACRQEAAYFYPKPWEALATGPRPKPATDKKSSAEPALLPAPDPMSLKASSNEKTDSGTNE